MNEYRLTRPHLYQCDCPGRTDPSARQGHYVHAENINAAADKLRKAFPAERFDVQYWGPNLYEHGELVLAHGAYMSVA
jgi:hypothetical protein